jgi:pimeloyl-ACP methyl ester carboxylesterase
MAVVRAPGADNLALKRAVFKMMDDTGPETFIRQQKAIMSRPVATVIGSDQLSDACAGGNDDALTPFSVALTIAEGIAGSKLDIVQDCGHLSTREQPDAVPPNV